MKKKEILIIFVLAILVTTLSLTSPFSELTMFQLAYKLVGSFWGPLLFRILILIGPPFPLFEEGPRWYEMLVFLSFLFLQFLFWCLVIFGVWKIVKWLKRKLKKR